MTTLKTILVVGLTVYLGLVAIMYFAQRALMYFPDTVRTAPAEAGLAQAQEVKLRSADGTEVIAWHVPPKQGKPVVIYFHGNGGSLKYRVPRFLSLIADGTGLVALSYRGFGGSKGSPTEAGLIGDGQAAFDFARKQYPDAKLVLWGESLGTGVAVAIAAKNDVAAVVLEAPYTSTVDIAFASYPFIPVRLLMKDQFRSDERIGRVKAPLLILHGAQDRIIPISYGERLFALANEPKQFVRFARGEHENLEQFGASQAAHDFFAKQKL
ncbi:MAG: alpha/beta hydrolase [Pseudorhodoplanes sp.]